METMIPPQVGMRLRMKNKKRRERKDAIKKGEKAQIKKLEKKREGTMLLSFATLVLQSSTVIFMIESLLFFHFHILVGIFIIELGLYIPMMGFLKMP